MFLLQSMFCAFWYCELQQKSESQKRGGGLLCDLGNLSVFSGLLHHFCIVFYVDS